MKRPIYKQILEIILDPLILDNTVTQPRQLNKRAEGPHVRAAVTTISECGKASKFRGQGRVRYQITTTFSLSRKCLENWY